MVVLPPLVLTSLQVSMIHVWSFFVVVAMHLPLSARRYTYMAVSEEVNIDYLLHFSACVIHLGMKYGIRCDIQKHLDRHLDSKRVASSKIGRFF